MSDGDALARLRDIWDEIAELVEDSYRLIAPKRLAALVEPQSREPE
ncbi:hypothetical protein ACQP1W_45470 [Spirillospora sp. CA-255316]